MVGGGFASTPYSSIERGNVVYDSSLTGAERGWRAQSLNVGSGTGTLTSEVYCRRGAPHLARHPVDVVLPSGGGAPPYASGSATATCNKGTFAAAGGFSGIASFDTPTTYSGDVILGSYRSGAHSWTVQSLNTANGTRHLDVDVYCLRNVHRPQVTASASTTTGPGGSASINSPICPKARLSGKGKKAPTTALAGGFLSTGVNLTGTLATSSGLFVGESRRLAGLWHTGAVSAGNLASGLQAFAYCG